eukprot:CAMPEP_0114342852 /NCGR_PEP_ID=MMETSP0101-20121206/10129_1 /TAXON_ID=38822 ORGANISM="Pteridomonas danica, Strain PT" /NCGR_SAMPLE_ID=MMETSP0101 /ASSEMBLY_ACC=CAM_ASM_000211 /LENGTH=138 /DNA_ID=CAMNT_0001477205 /DNA_START=1566 /DNA_END=1979 /DNA_ORIENTATION=-
MILEAIQYHGSVIKYTSFETKNDIDIIYEAVSYFPIAFEYAHEDVINKFESYLSNRLDRYSISIEDFRNSILLGLNSNYNKNKNNNNNINDDDDGSVYDMESKNICSLFQLNQLGKYGLLDVKKLIGEYVGLQLGEEW